MGLNKGDLVWIPSDTVVHFAKRKKEHFVRTKSPSTGLFLQEVSGAAGAVAVVYRYGEEVRISPRRIRKMEA